MISKKTVLILGAGASQEYGYPLAEALKKEVLDKLKDEGVRRMMRDTHGFSDFLVDNFHSALQLSGFKYIEEFLSIRPEFQEIGKLLIAQVILEHEHIPSLFKDGLWYSYLFEAINESFLEIKDNKLSVITFNFDQSLETFLFNAVKNAYSKSEQDVLTELAHIPVLHVNGKVNDKLWQGVVSDLPTSSKITPELIKNAASGIKIVTDKDFSSGSLKRNIDSILDGSEVIVFLGFGFDDVNMKKLNISRLKGKTIIGSTYGIKPGEIRSIIRNSGDKIVLGKTKLVQALDVKGYLKESGALGF
jgi:hypothetical protein